MLRKIIRKVRKIIKKVYYNLKIKSILVSSDKDKIIYIGSPLHGNIGDHAISIAIMNLLKELNKKIVEIPGEMYMMCRKKVISYVNVKDTILITGGGLIGNLWMNEEEMIKNVIQTFDKNKIIIMPQTYYFDNNKEGQEELKDFKKIVDNHKNIYLCAREENSYKLCKENFKNVKGCYLLPDVVLTLNYSNSAKRNGILCCLREDKEKTLNIDELNKLIDNDIIKYTSTVSHDSISVKKRLTIFESKLEEFRNSKLVITDRLHGMIFAVITGTPCIAFDNKSKKVSGVYKLLKNLDYVLFCYDKKDLKNLINQIELNKTYKYDLDQKCKNQIINCLKGII